MRIERPPLTFEQAFDRPSPVVGDAESGAVARLLADYRPWRKTRYAAAELGLDPETAWLLTKRARFPMFRRVSLPRAEGGRFGLTHTPQMAESLLLIDRSTGVVGTPRVRQNLTLHKRLLALAKDGQLTAPRRVRTDMEEAAESAIIEGASGTRQEAIELLRSGRRPKSISERMVINNYMTMQRIKELVDTPLSPALILELQELITEGTLDDPAEAGRFRRAEQPVRIVDTRDETVIFEPPHAALVVDYVTRLCKFANTDHAGADFLHPVIKAAILHFMIGYIHPFADGNGRTARAMFYWFALRHGYTLFEYLSISEVIRKGYARYPQAYVDVETDDGDLTYFVLYKLDIISQALDRLAEKLALDAEKIKLSERLLALAEGLNLRQRLLLEHSLRHPLTQYTVKTHANSNGIVLTTARADLEQLVILKLLATAKRGKEVIYMATPKLTQRLAAKRLV